MLILKHVLLRLLQKYLSLVFNAAWTGIFGICIVVKFFQPYVAATVSMHSDAVLSSTGAPIMKTVRKK